MTQRTKARPVQVSEREVDAMLGVTETLRGAFALQLSASALLEALDKGERQRLLALTRKLKNEWGEVPPRAAPQLVPGRDERARGELYADAIERLPTGSNKRLKREQQLTAEYARQVGRVPSPEERAVLRGVSANTKLDELRNELAAAGGAPRGAGVYWANLDEAETDELEGLVEKALGDPGYLRRRRGEQARRVGLDLFARKLDEPPALRLLAPEGAAVLPAAVLDDLHAGRLLGIDVALLGVVALTFASRRVHPRVERDVAWEDDGATLVVRGGPHRLLPEWAQADSYGQDPVSMGRDGIGRRLKAAGWLAIEGGGGERPARVRLGERLLEERSGR